MEWFMPAVDVGLREYLVDSAIVAAEGECLGVGELSGAHDGVWLHLAKLGMVCIEKFTTRA